MRNNYKKAIASLCAVLIIGCSSPGEYGVQTGGPEVVTFKVLPFALEEVKLLEGPFLHATELNKQSLLQYIPDRFLSKFRTEAGLEPKEEHYHGWEDNTIAGHSLGHYLSACSMMYQTMGDERFLERVNYLVNELALVQDAGGDGYIGAFPEGKRILEEEVARGEIRSKGFDLNGIWVPYYTQHKVMAGLFDAFNLCRNQQALQVNIRFANWLETVVGGLNDSLVQVMLHCEHGGINESLAELYGYTGNERYLDLSRLFHHRAILDSLEAGVDVLPGKHGNTQIPKLIGLARRYELTGDPDEKKTAMFFWETVVDHHSYVTGGHGNHEYFGRPDSLSARLSDGTTETCNVYNMLKLSRHLFQWEASAKVADYYERALINQILSSQHPGDGRVIYNLSLEMGGHKTYQDPLWFTCCVGSGMENHSKYAGNIYFHNDKELFISQFIASELRWKKKGLVVRQINNYPEEHGTSLEFECDGTVPLDMMIRYPYWAVDGISVHVNGKEQKVKEEPGSFIRISRDWTTGDKIEIQFPFTLRIEAMPDNPNRLAVMYGPLVMAGDLGPDDDSSSEDPVGIPVFLTDNRDPADWFEPIEGERNTFKSHGVGKPGDVTIRPFYKTHERRYTVYWDLFNEQSWSEKEQAQKARLERNQKIKEMNIDFVQMGEMQPERDHHLKGENTSADEFKGKKMRESRNGWFSVDLDVFKGQPMALVVEYWGGFPGSKTFDIYIDEHLLTTENISNIRDGQFIDQLYEIPDEMTFDKTTITVKFKAHEGHTAGPVFTVRTVKR